MAVKKRVSLLLAAVLLLSVTVTAVAAEPRVCLEAEQVTAVAGETFTLSVSLTENTGFTNLAVTLDYDRAALTLTDLSLGELGHARSSNPRWQDGDKELIYAVFASPQPETGTGVLFTATFTLAEGFTGTAAVTPTVVYARNNEAVFSVFEELTAEAVPGSVTAGEAGILPGDVNGDGSVTSLDLTQMYNALRYDSPLTEERFAAADYNGDGAFTAMDLTAVYNLIRFAD